MTTKFKRLKLNGTNVRILRAKQKIAPVAMRLIGAYAPGISKAIVKKMFFAPAVYRITAAEQDCLEKGEAFNLSVHGRTVRCWKWGAGPGILLVHGWSGRGIQLYRFIEPLVRAGYSVMTFDAPGHGQSQGKTSSYFEFTDTIQIFLSSGNGYHTQGVIAHSLGASAVINCLAKTNRPQIPVLIAPALKLAERVLETFEDYGVPEPVYQSLIGTLEDRYGYSMHGDNPDTLANSLTSRMLIVHDRDDPTIPFMDSKALFERSTHVALHATRGLGHKRILSDSAVIDFIVDYIRRADNGASDIDSKEEKNENN